LRKGAVFIKKQCLLASFGCIQSRLIEARKNKAPKRSFFDLQAAALKQQD
jgi:hypothetical protein